MSEKHNHCPEYETGQDSPPLYIEGAVCPIRNQREKKHRIPDPRPKPFTVKLDPEVSFILADLNLTDAIISLSIGSDGRATLTIEPRP